MVAIKLVIIIVLLIYINGLAPYTREGVVFGADYLLPYYKKHNITINPYKKILHKNGKTISYATQFNPPTSKLISKDKIKSKELFIKNQIPTAKYYKWDPQLSYTINVRNMNRKLKYPIVIKPSDSYAGDGVYTNITNVREALPIIKKLLERHANLIIEEYIDGNSYRILLFNDTIIYAYRVTKPAVIGDGISTVNQLINNLRKKLDSPIDEKQINIKSIINQGYTMNTIVPKNKSVIITDISNSTYGSEREIVDVSHIHPDNIKMFKKLNMVTGLKLNGIDYISNSGLNIPYYKSNGNILETNSSPGISFIPNIDGASDKFIRSINFN